MNSAVSFMWHNMIEEEQDIALPPEYQLGSNDPSRLINYIGDIQGGGGVMTLPDNTGVVLIDGRGSIIRRRNGEPYQLSFVEIQRNGSDFVHNERVRRAKRIFTLSTVTGDIAIKSFERLMGDDEESNE